MADNIEIKEDNSKIACEACKKEEMDENCIYCSYFIKECIEEGI